MKKNNKKRKSHRIVWVFIAIIVSLILLILSSFLPETIIPEKLKPGHQLLIKTRKQMTDIVGKKTTSEESPQGSPAIMEDSLTICSFSILSLGNTKSKENKALAYTLKDYDIVVIQGLVAPPYPIKFPDGRPAKPTNEAKDFFNAMLTHGFEYELSPEDTGPGEKIHKNNESTEWWVAFYKPNRVTIAPDLPGGYLAGDRSNHADYERVPYAFAFRTFKNNLDFILISTHLNAGTSERDKLRRKHELKSIKSWIETKNKVEKDFIILGNMNIENTTELTEVIPFGLKSLNDECRPTTTNLDYPRPHNHIMYNPLQTEEINEEFGIVIIDLKKDLQELWRKDDPYPGAPYDPNRFTKYYSAYQPIVFRLNIPKNDDDE